MRYIVSLLVQGAAACRIALDEQVLGSSIFGLWTLSSLSSCMAPSAVRQRWYTSPSFIIKEKALGFGTLNAFCVFLPLHGLGSVVHALHIIGVFFTLLS